MAEKIGQLAKVVMSEIQSKCERCKTRRVWNRKIWCRRCQNWWHRREDRQGTHDYLVALLGSRFCYAKLYHLCKPLLKAFQQLEDEDAIMLWGDVGVGKTYAMAALARRFYIQGWDVKFLSWYELILQVRQFHSVQDEISLIRPYCDVDKLFIDDLGTNISKDGSESDHSLRSLALILDKRLAFMRPTFVTSNRSIEDLSQTFDERIASRLQESCIIIHTQGKDRRATKKL